MSKSFQKFLLFPLVLCQIIFFQIRHFLHPHYFIGRGYLRIVYSSLELLFSSFLSFGLPHQTHHHNLLFGSCCPLSLQHKLLLPAASLKFPHYFQFKLLAFSFFFFLLHTKNLHLSFHYHSSKIHLRRYQVPSKKILLSFQF